MKQKVFVVLSCLALFATPALAATYKIDAVHSSAVFSIKHFGICGESLLVTFCTDF